MPRKSSLMSGVWKRSMARLVRHRPTKGPATDMPNPNHRATPRLYSGRKNELTLRQEARERRIISNVKPFIGTLRVTNPVR
jgi:hypothetical protein